MGQIRVFSPIGSKGRLWICRHNQRACESRVFIGLSGGGKRRKMKDGNRTKEA
jgi:hypothetical protein